MRHRRCCSFTGKVPLMNHVCSNCKLFLETCIPVADYDGFALGSECSDYYFCSGCSVEQCDFKETVNL